MGIARRKKINFVGTRIGGAIAYWFTLTMSSTMQLLRLAFSSPLCIAL